MNSWVKGKASKGTVKYWEQTVTFKALSYNCWFTRDVRPCWGNWSLFSCKFCEKNCTVLTSNMTALLRGWKPWIYHQERKRFTVSWIKSLSDQFKNSIYCVWKKNEAAACRQFKVGNVSILNSLSVKKKILKSSWYYLKSVIPKNNAWTKIPENNFKL